MSFEEGHAEIASLLEYSKAELMSGRALAGLAMLFEAQFILNKMVQLAMEGALGITTKIAGTRQEAAPRPRRHN